MRLLQFYTRPDCSLCDSAFAVIKRLQTRFPFQIEVVNIDESPTLRARFGDVIPVLCAGETELARSFFDEKTLIEKLKNQPDF